MASSSPVMPNRNPSSSEAVESTEYERTCYSIVKDDPVELLEAVTRISEIFPWDKALALNAENLRYLHAVLYCITQFFLIPKEDMSGDLCKTLKKTLLPLGIAREGELLVYLAIPEVRAVNLMLDRAKMGLGKAIEVMNSEIQGSSSLSESPSANGSSSFIPNVDQAAMEEVQGLSTPDPTKLLQLVIGMLSLFGEDGTSVVSTERILFLNVSLKIMEEALSMPPCRVPKHLEEVLVKIYHHSESKSQEWVIFDVAQTSAARALLREWEDFLTMSIAEQLATAEPVDSFPSSPLLHESTKSRPPSSQSPSPYSSKVDPAGELDKPKDSSSSTKNGDAYLEAGGCDQPNGTRCEEPAKSHPRAQDLVQSPRPNLSSESNEAPNPRADVSLASAKQASLISPTMSSSSTEEPLDFNNIVGSPSLPGSGHSSSEALKNLEYEMKLLTQGMPVIKQKIPKQGAHSGTPLPGKSDEDYGSRMTTTQLASRPKTVDNVNTSSTPSVAAAKDASLNLPAGAASVNIHTTSEKDNDLVRTVKLQSLLAKRKDYKLLAKKLSTQVSELDTSLQANKAEQIIQVGHRESLQVKTHLLKECLARKENELVDRATKLEAQIKASYRLANDNTTMRATLDTTKKKLTANKTEFSHVLQKADRVRNMNQRLEEELFAKEKQLSDQKADCIEAIKSYQEGQKQAEQVAKVKDALVEAANAEVEQTKMDLAQFKKDGKDMITKTRQKLEEMRLERGTNRLELTAAIADRSHAEGKVAGLEADKINLQEELKDMEAESALLRAENSRLLAQRTNPQAEQDRVEKAVRDAVAAREVQLQGRFTDLETELAIARLWAANADEQIRRYSREGLQQKTKISILEQRLLTRWKEFNEEDDATATHEATEATEMTETIE